MKIWYLVLLFATTIVGYLMGYTSPFFRLLQRDFSITSFLSELATNSGFLFPFVFAAFGAGLGFIHSGIVRDALLIGLLVFFANFTFLPISFLRMDGVPFIIKALIVSFWNLLWLMFVLDFIG